MVARISSRVSSDSRGPAPRAARASLRPGFRAFHIPGDNIHEAPVRWSLFRPSEGLGRRVGLVVVSILSPPGISCPSLTKNNRDGDCDNREMHSQKTGKSCLPNVTLVDTLDVAPGLPVINVR